MDFTLNDEQRMFAEAAATLFADSVTPDHWRRMMAVGEAYDPTRWKITAENGLTSVLLPEAVGGLGLGEVDFLQIARAAGYVALPEPLVESAGIAMPMLAAISPDHPLLADPAALVVAAPLVNPFVNHADRAAVILAERDGHAFLVDPARARLTAEPGIDPFRRLFRVDWLAADATDLGPADWSLAFDRAAVFLAAEGLGLAQRCVDLAVAYAKDRQQFGKPIGVNQAVKHQLASAQTAIEFARPVVTAAAAQIGQQDAFSRARASHAKIVALEAADIAARTAIQVHGAMGYSWEVDVHLFLKRALALGQAWGTPFMHRQRVATRVFGRPTGPDQTFAKENAHV